MCRDINPLAKVKIISQLKLISSAGYINVSVGIKYMRSRYVIAALNLLSKPRHLFQRLSDAVTVTPTRIVAGV